MKKIFRKFTPALLAVVLLAAGCNKDYLVTNPSDAVSGETVFETTDGAYVSLNGTYRMMWASQTSHGDFGQKSVDISMDLMGNDMVVHKQGYGWFNAEYNYSAYATSTSGSRSGIVWAHYYRMINNANRILANIDNAIGSQDDIDNIKGQAYVIRAHSYFYLVNLYQHTYKGNENAPGVPLYESPTSEGAGRGTVQDVYDLINADLTAAKPLLEGKSRKHISHIDKRTAHAVHAMVALQQEDYPTARTEAAAARAGMTPATAAQYRGGTIFNTSGGPEYIWGVTVNTEQATIYASFYSHMDISSGGYAALGTQKKITKALYDEMADSDVRKELFSPYPFTTAPGSLNPPLNQNKIRLRQAGNWAADYLFMRVAEQYLIEAEAAAKTNAEGEAIQILEALITTRDPNYSAAGLTGQALLDEIYLQRRIELWGEGRALLDMKRLQTGLNRPTGDGNHNGWDLINEENKALNFNVPATGATNAITIPDKDPRFLWRIPQNEIDANKNLTDADQNP